jgi:hypothetical protein
MEAKHASSTTAKRPSTCSLKREMVGLYTHFATKKKKIYKLMWLNMIGYEINSNFEKANHIVLVNFFFVKYVCKPSIFLKKNIIICL